MSWVEFFQKNNKQEGVFTWDARVHPSNSVLTCFHVYLKFQYLLLSALFSCMSLTSSISIKKSLNTFIKSLKSVCYKKLYEEFPLIETSSYIPAFKGF